MKANQRFSRDEGGVSPVIGTLLAVAITAALGALVFVVVAQTGQDQRQAPSIQFLIDNRSGQIGIIRADANVDISNVEVRMSVAGHFGYKVPAGLGSSALLAGTFTPLAASKGTTFTGGDAINFCANAGGPGITVTVRYAPANQILYTNSFTTLATCG
jgi:FlaG/FlaF family flagellin (archaellin)